MQLFCPICQKAVIAMKSSFTLKDVKREVYSCPNCISFLASADTHLDKK